MICQSFGYGWFFLRVFFFGTPSGCAAAAASGFRAVVRAPGLLLSRPVMTGARVAVAGAALPAAVVAASPAGRSRVAVLPIRRGSAGVREEGGAVGSLSLVSGASVGFVEGGHTSVGRVDELWGGQRGVDVTDYLAYRSARVRLERFQ